MSLESPLLSRVVRLLSFGTGDPRFPTFPLARSVPGQSGDTRPFAIVLQETLARIDAVSWGASSVKILREIARISTAFRPTSFDRAGNYWFSRERTGDRGKDGG